MNKDSFGYKLAEAGYQLYKLYGDAHAKDFMQREMRINEFKIWECTAVANMYRLLKQGVK